MLFSYRRSFVFLLQQPQSSSNNNNNNMNNYHYYYFDNPAGEADQCKLKKERGKKCFKKMMGALLPAAKNRLGTMGKLSVISVHSEPLRLKAMLYAIRTEYKLFTSFE